MIKKEMLKKRAERLEALRLKNGGASS